MLIKKECIIVLSSGVTHISTIKVVCIFTYDFKVPTEQIVIYRSLYQMLQTNQEDISCPRYRQRFFSNNFTKVMDTIMTKNSSLGY